MLQKYDGSSLNLLGCIDHRHERASSKISWCQNLFPKVSSDVQLCSRNVLLSLESFWRSALLTPLVYHRLFHPVVRSCRSASKHIQCMCPQSLFISPREMVVFVCSAFGHASCTSRVSFSPNTYVCPPLYLSAAGHD